MLITSLGVLSAWAGASEAGQCEVAPFRGATRPGGATTTMTVLNDGTPCSIRNFIDPESRTRPAELRAIREPRNGTLTISQPDTISYVPGPGFSGADTFSYAGRGRARDGSTLELLVNVSVTVVPAPARTKP